MKPDRTRIEAFLGLRSDVSLERMSPGDLIEAVNVRFDKTGQMFRRQGSELRQVGTANSLWSDGEVALVVFNGVLSRVHPDLSLTALQPVPRSSEPLNYERVNGLVYWSNATHNGIVDPGNNTVRAWGMPVPGAPTCRVVSGDMPAGLYQYAITWLRADGQESGASPTMLVQVPEGSGLYIEAPPSPAPDVIRVMLYITTPGGQTLYRAAELAHGEEGGYRGNTLDLNAPILTQFMAPPPPAQTLGFFNGRLWLALDDTLLPSAPFSMELFNLMDYLPLQGRITMIAPQREGWGLWVGTDQGLFYLSGKDPKDMEIKQHSEVGVIAGTLVYIPGDKFGEGQFSGMDVPVWASENGLCAGLPTPEGKVLMLTEGKNPFRLAGHGHAYFDGENVVVSTTEIV
jgi:hypothetical protein